MDQSSSRSPVRGALPESYDREFLSLEPVVRAAPRRENASAAALWLDRYEKTRVMNSQRTMSIEEQLNLACAREPRRFQSRLHKVLNSGPAARSDAEESERQRWILTGGELLRNTSTPTEQLISQDPEKLKVLGAGRRVSTLRSQIRTIRKFLSWLTASHGVVFPTLTEHCSGFLEVGASEPCTRTAIKEAHRSMVFLELTAGVEEQERVTGTSIYKTIFDEISISTSPGRSARQAPTMFLLMLKALEMLVVDTKALPFISVYSWWILLPNWGTLRFSDHRGLRPQDIKIMSNTLDATLSRSKTTGRCQRCQQSSGTCRKLLLCFEAIVDLDWLESTAKYSSFCSRLSSAYADRQLYELQATGIAI